MVEIALIEKPTKEKPTPVELALGSWASEDEEILFHGGSPAAEIWRVTELLTNGTVDADEPRNSRGMRVMAVFVRYVNPEYIPAHTSP